MLYFKHPVWVLGLLPFTMGFNSLKFQEWFPDFEADLSPSWKTGNCRTAHSNYLYHRTQFHDTCGALLECILDNTSEKRKTTMASASVALALTPPLLAGLGQSLAEISLLSSQRPVLSALLALGAPALYPNRIFEYTHPPDALSYLPGNRGLRRLRPSLSVSVSILEYLLTAGTVANNIELAIRIGVRSVLAWSCNSWYMPLVWVFYPISLHVIATLGYRYMIPPIPIRSGSGGRLWRILIMEVTPSSNCESFGIPKAAPTAIAILLQIFASALAFGHVVLGTLTLSSLIFIGFHDTLWIMFRFLGSALVCRGIFMFELAGIREVLKYGADES
ncbi:hypothetical protein MMC22_011719 [Lobaria immixta]|nr:hypothetical protein [Lobaria immixta]